MAAMPWISPGIACSPATRRKRSPGQVLARLTIWIRALARAKQVAADTKKKRDIEAEREDAARRAGAWRIWSAAERSVLGTYAESYLSGRGIDLRALPHAVGSLRYVPELHNVEADRKLPAMIAAIIGRDNKFLGIHRTWLKPTRHGATKADLADAKLTLGKYRDAGGSIRLWAGAGPRGGKGRALGDLDQAWADGRLTKNESRVSITEGIEDGLTGALAAPELRVLVAVSVAQIASMWLPDAIREAILIADNDEPNSAAAKQLEKGIQRFWNDGRQVRLIRAPEGKDINAYLTRSKIL